MAAASETPKTFQARSEGGARLALVGELDLATTPILRAALHTLPLTEQVTLDLSQLEFIDSCGLREISAYATSLNGNGPLILENVPRFVASLLEIVALDRLDSIQIS